MNEQTRNFLMERFDEAGMANSGQVTDCLLGILEERDVEHLKELSLEDMIAYTGNKMYQEMKQQREQLTHTFDVGVLLEGLQNYIVMLQKYQAVQDAYIMLNTAPVHEAERRR